ncbi:MAG: PP2C family protein-serine/threonine phosphatase [Thermoanaerobaculia bacterium]
MPHSVPTAERSDAWTALADANREPAAERKVLHDLLKILTLELGASRATLNLDNDVSGGSPLAVGSAAADSGDSSERRAFTVPVPGGSVVFEGAPGSPTRLDGPRQAALAAAVRAFEHSRRLKRQKFEVNYRGVELEALYDVGLAIASTLNLDELSEEILLRAVSLLDARRGAFYLRDDEEFRLERTFGGSASTRLPVGSIEGLLRGGAQEDLEVLPGGEHLLAVPIGSGDDVRGLLLVADKESRDGVGPFGSSDRRTLELFANQAAIALENAHLHKQALEKERLEREAELAADIQRRLLPEATPEIAGFELAGWNRPARMVGGDYYNYFHLEEGIHFVVLGDVTGKGMPAALLVSTLHSALRLLLAQGLRREALLSALNGHIWSSSAANTFITLAALEIDPRTGATAYASGGHNPTLWLGGERPVRQLGASGLPIGLFEAASYSFEELDLESGDLVCLYSDGITECESEEEVEYGMARLEEVLRMRLHSSLVETVDSIRGEITEFAGAGPQGDDQTVVLIRKT